MRLNRLSLEPADVQVMIEAASIEQRLVRAPFDHLIGITDGAQPVRDHANQLKTRRSRIGMRD